MPGSELVDREELESINTLWEKGQGNLYRYGFNQYAVQEFEKRFSDYMGCKYAHAVSSGTAAIHCALSAAGISSGDEVITTSFTFVAPIEAILAVGAKPIPVDIDESFHLDPVMVEKAISPKTKAVLTIPMWASPKMAKIENLCKKFNLILIEDAAQCLGGTYEGKKLGTIGKIGSFSFDSGKTITTGEGGMIITDEKDLYERVAEFSDHGHMHDDSVPRGKDPRRSPGLNYRMGEVNAAIGLAQLKKINYILKTQRENLKILYKHLTGIHGLTLRPIDFLGNCGILIFTLESEKSSQLVAQHLSESSIPNSILPEAFEWHFSGNWQHIFSGKLFDWQKTRDLLIRSIGIPIKVSYEQRDLIQIVKEIKKVISLHC